MNMYSSAAITGAVNLALFGVVVLIRRRVHKEGLAAFGLRRDARSWRLLLQGFVAGALAFLAYPIAVVGSGVGTLSVAGQQLPATLLLLVSWGLADIGVALFEEALFRGYLLQKLCVRFSRAGGIAGQALLTAAFHLMAYSGAEYLWLGLLNAALLAALLAVVVQRTQSLMPAVGFHAMWDLSETILLLYGTDGVETIWNLHVEEGIWTGTHSTPETGLIVSFVLVGMSLLLTFCCRGLMPGHTLLAPPGRPALAVGVEHRLSPP